MFQHTSYITDVLVKTLNDYIKRDDFLIFNNDSYSLNLNKVSNDFYNKIENLTFAEAFFCFKKYIKEKSASMYNDIDADDEQFIF